MWTLNQLCQVMNARCDADETQSPSMTGACIDTRHLNPGEVFFALEGAHHDGHAFAAQAESKGAAAIVATRPVAVNIPVILVDDVVESLQTLARWHRQQMPLKALIGVTGSNGKTTTKAMLAHCLSQSHSVCATEGNYNNHLGVPLTLLRIRPEHEYAVVEMGANHAYEIGELCRIALPDCGVLTLAAGAHLEGFGSLETIIETKGELLSSIPADGYGVINADSAGFSHFETICLEKGMTCIRFGQADNADLRLVDVQQNDQGLSFGVVLQQEAGQPVQTLQLPVLGEHNAWNAVACAAVCVQEGMDWSSVANALARFEAVDQRMQVHPLAHGRLINDVYNANPSSMKAAIQTLAALKHTHTGDRALACLGPMSELGARSEAEHLGVAKALLDAGIDHVLLYGAPTRPMLSVLGKRAQWFDTHQALLAEAHQLLADQACQHILIKGSRSARMEAVSDPLIQRWAQPTHSPAGSDASC
ncbi:UDP-N-acetylmuramoyl-tripeptide--D-alanyl-D-alanine ligase [Thiomicrospira sp. WB1]|uniref:UDP-N-acetylmuramoyl-tripeptide--D-alanyl-D- alanine ligase n=1 Tax=Thiomicrospira sp. WB1 TaxID=1685380 RepID=UPI00074B1F44|nr:UDP-N-acetylmuramoyl-tripeptide--D-alanyl-D-alanine ligase [Thiomicrospira sp. WB1]KUJ71381.1 hypothetical protein AVO41_07570 [Thiomicrospira sp. WB1]